MIRLIHRDFGVFDSKLWPIPIAVLPMQRETCRKSSIITVDFLEI